MLYESFLKNTGRPILKWTHYFSIYERYFERFRNQSLVMIEIGVFKGGSLQLWKNYFGPLATIVGIDIDEKCKQYEDEQCKVRIGNQTDTAFLHQVVEEFGRPDIIVDDGSHIQNDMFTTFNFLYPALKNNGVYIVEDCHTCYWPKWGGGFKKSDTFIEKSKNMIDLLNEDYFRIQGKRSEFTKQTFSIAFYDSMVVFEKKIHPKSRSVMTGIEN